MTTDTTMPLDEAVVEQVRIHYAGAARSVLEGSSAESSSDGCCSPSSEAHFDALGYTALDRAALPDAAVLASLGCGNPIAVAELRPGEVVLDLGSGGGIDVLLSAKRVGPTGYAYGLDMTDEMLALARSNADEAGATNVEFRKGRMESIPLPDASVDVVISNCVINLSVDKLAVFGEIARVLRPGGRMGVSDIVADDRLTPTERAERGSFAGCVAGALSIGEFRSGLEAVGLTDVSITPAATAGEGIYSAIVRATKPADWTVDDMHEVRLPTPSNTRSTSATGLPVIASNSCCGGSGCC